MTKVPSYLQEVQASKNTNGDLQPIAMKAKVAFAEHGGTVQSKQIASMDTLQSKTVAASTFA